jgi:CxxC motif-containing protein (DUF1111 family)
VRRIAIVFACTLGCGDNLPGDDRQGGANTVDDRTATAFTHPTPGLSDDDLATHETGRGPFDFHWEPPQLGPLFNNDSCFGCHGGNGRGLSEIGPDQRVSQALVRCSLPTGTPDVPGGAVSVPGYGTQLQDHATGGLAEVNVELTWIEHADTLGDGTNISLRAPHVVVTKPDGSSLPPETLFSYRQAPGVFGLGLLAAIDDATLLALADPDDADGDGISGRVNMVWDVATSSTVVGRFGHKANAPNLRQQVSAAFVNDMGLTNQMFPETDGTRDVPDLQLDQTVFFIQTLAVPAAAARDAAALRGRGLFGELGCASCHLPTLVTGDASLPMLAHQTIHPYTDLLLHDMGDGLADHRPDFAATGSEWRTPPLWGLGLVQIVAPGATFLHDGRARTVEEAILWHGGEAAGARDAFRSAAKPDRDALIAFLNTL